MKLRPNRSLGAAVAAMLILSGCPASEPNPTSITQVPGTGEPMATPANDVEASAVPPDRVEQWGVWEWRIDAANAGDVAANLVAPDGRQITVSAFSADGDESLIRYRPDEPGMWRFDVDRAGVPLPGMEGSFFVEPSAGSNAIMSHGPVTVGDGAEWFEHADGTPFMWIADTAWSGALLSSSDDWDRYLTDRVSKGFTAIQIVLTPWRAAPVNAEGQVAFSLDPEFTINYSFFERIDQRIAAANRAGLLVIPVLLWANGDGPLAAPGQLPAPDAIQLARYLVARYSAYHVVWLLGGDVSLAGGSASRWGQIARAVFDDSQQVVGMHPVGREWAYGELENDDWLSFYGYQSGHGDSDEALEWIHHGPQTMSLGQRPVVNLELPYEGHLSYDHGVPLDAHAVRRAAYWSVLSTPTAGVSYGAHGVWSWQTIPAEPTGHAGAGIAQPWHEAIDLPGSGQMGYLAAVLRDVEWWTLKPAQELLDEQPGTGDPALHIAVASTATGDVIAYAPRGGTIKLRQIDPIDAFRASWVDPRTGAVSAAEPVADGHYETPDDGDWVLVLKRP